MDMRVSVFGILNLPIQYESLTRESYGMNDASCRIIINVGPCTYCDDCLLMVEQECLSANPTKAMAMAIMAKPKSSLSIHCRCFTIEGRYFEYYP